MEEEKKETKIHIKNSYSPKLRSPQKPTFSLSPKTTKTPSIIKARLELKEKELSLKRTQNEFENENFYRCCSGTKSDKRVIEFFSKFVICVIVLMFCIVQLYVHHDNCNSNSLYGNILSMILGLFLPTPRVSKKDHQSK